MCSTMTEAQLNGLVILFVHRDIPCDIFAKSHPRLNCAA